jgi:glucose-1-phosphate thymidylyltransferase
MKVIIPLAGFGTRLRPHTYTRPKPLVNVAGKPVLGHILDKLKGLDIEEIIFVVGYLGEQIEAYVKANYDFPAHYVEQKELLGQAHAIHLAREHLQGPALIIFVDTIFEADLAALAKSPNDGVLFVKEVEDPRRFGVVVIENGHVVKLIEKPSDFAHNLAVIGVYYFRDSHWLATCIDELIRNKIQTKGEYYLADAIQLMINQGAQFVASPVDVWEDCGKPDTVLHTNRYLLEKTGGQQIPTNNSVLIPPVYIARSANIANSIVGPYVTIAEDAVIHNAIIKDSIINEGAVIEDVMLSGSLIGSHAQVRRTFEQLNVGDSSQIDVAGNHKEDQR